MVKLLCMNVYPSKSWVQSSGSFIVLLYPRFAWMSQITILYIYGLWQRKVYHDLFWVLISLQNFGRMEYPYFTSHFNMPVCVDIIVSIWHRLDHLCISFSPLTSKLYIIGEIICTILHAKLVNIYVRNKKAAMTIL